MVGHFHPTTILIDRIVKLLKPYGFEVLQGPEIETEEYNFDLLNMPNDHPARDEHDTFYLTDGRLLRTHTSPMQIRAVREMLRKPPIRLLVPGRAFRNEATDATHDNTFYQIEGLAVDVDISLAHLIGTLTDLLRSLFPPDTEIRFRTGNFPFVEPGIEVDIKPAGGKWSEVLGAGMVHPKVLGNMGLDPDQYQGFAFGIGIERLNRLITGSNDLRVNFANDYRYLGQT